MNRRRVSLLVALLGAALVIGAPVAALGSTGAHRASAELRDAAGSVVGWAALTEDATGRLHVNVHVKGISSGLHGIHIHAVGSCSPDFGAAGGHHNPLAVPHGLDTATGGHAGDLPNLEVNVAGVGHLNGTSDRASLSSGSTTIFDGNGSALVIHAGPDDQVTNPTGNSGGRIACGVIVAG